MFLENPKLIELTYCCYNALSTDVHGYLISIRGGGKIEAEGG